jgi:hypothetical protein
MQFAKKPQTFSIKGLLNLWPRLLNLLPRLL